MKRTLEEKLNYNRSKNTGFSNGYVIGVMLYRDYIKGDSEHKKIVKEATNASNELARKGDSYGKGFMCGVRDAANERKSRQKR